MKTRTINFAIGATALFVAGAMFISWQERVAVRTYGGVPMPDLTSAPATRETPEQRLQRFRLEARDVAGSYVSNTVVGFRRISYIAADTRGAHVTNWTGSAQAEFINQVGGVSLQIVDFEFYLGRTGKILYARADTAKRMDEIKGAFWRGMGVTNRPANGWPALPGAQVAN